MSAIALDPYFAAPVKSIDCPVCKLYIGLLVAVALAGHILEAARLARLVQQVDALDLHLEHQFDGLLHFAFDASSRTRNTY
jgi:hypothetical protein